MISVITIPLDLIYWDILRHIVANRILLLHHSKLNRHFLIKKKAKITY
jgi:hypothetical protein